MPRPLSNPQRRDRERKVVAELYHLVFPDDDKAHLKIHSSKPYFYLRAEGLVYKVEVKEVESSVKGDANSK